MHPRKKSPRWPVFSEDGLSRVRRTRPTCPHGFTMLELLIALAIMSLAFAIIWSTFSTTVRAWTRGSELLDDLHHGDFVMEQMVSALRSAAFFSTAPGKYGFHLKDRGTGSEASDIISWVTSGTAFLPPDSPLANGLHRITITIEDNRDGKPAVCVKAYPHLADVDEDSVETEKWYVSTEVKGLDCQVYNKEDEDWDGEWEDTNSIPRLVQITLYMEPLEKYGDPVKLERLIELPVAPALDAAVTPEGAQGTGTEGDGRSGDGSAPPAQTGATPENSGGDTGEKPSIQSR